MTHAIPLSGGGAWNGLEVAKATWDLAHNAAVADTVMAWDNIEVSEIAVNNWRCRRICWKFNVPTYNFNCLADAGLFVTGIDVFLTCEGKSDADGAALVICEGFFTTPVVGDYDDMLAAVTAYATKLLADIPIGAFTWAVALPATMWVQLIRGFNPVRIGLRIDLDINDTPPTGSNLFNPLSTAGVIVKVNVPDIEVHTHPATDITSTTAKIWGHVWNDQGFPYFNFKLRWKVLGDPFYTVETQVYTGGGPTQLFADIAGLTPNTTYTFGAFIDNLFGVTLTPPELQFTTLPAGGGGSSVHSAGSVMPLLL